MIQLNGEILEPTPGSILIVRHETPRDQGLMEGLREWAVANKISVLVMKPEVSIEEIPREQAMGILMGIAGIGKSDWSPLPDEALAALIRVHRKEAESMERDLEARAALRKQANGGKVLEIFVLYDGTTTDYPGEWVVRRRESGALGDIPDHELVARGATREACMSQLLYACPRVSTMVYLDRFPNDDPCIAGTFV